MSDNGILLVGLAAIFVALVLLLATAGVITAERAQVNRSLAALRAIEMAPAGMRKELDRPFAERVLRPSITGLTNLGRRFTPKGQVERLQKRLDIAGSPENWDVDRVLAFKMLGLFAGALITIAVALGLQPGVLPVIGVAVLLCAGGYFAPNIVLYQVGYERMDRIRKDLPDALDMLTITVEAGLGFDAALSQVARNTEGPLAAEFFRVLQEMQIGMGRMDALRALSERADLPELRGFVTSMIQADAFGIPIANVLRVQAKEMRIKRSQRAEEQAMKVPVKILFPLIFCILPTLFIVVIGPGAVNIFHSLIQSN
jgi:tight adherence protein C